AAGHAPPFRLDQEGEGWPVIAPKPLRAPLIESSRLRIHLPADQGDLPVEDHSCAPQLRHRTGAHGVLHPVRRVGARGKLRAIASSTALKAVSTLARAMAIASG
ncbi:hypothetical protein ACFQFG_28220, partial [Methylobacterium persicinum]